MSLRRDFAWLSAQQAAVLGVGVVTGGLVNRALGPESRGVYAEVQTWIGLFVALGGLSLESGIRHFTNRARYGDDDRARLVTAGALSAACALLAGLAWLLLISLRPELVSAQIATLAVLMGLVLMLTMTGGHLLVLLQSLGLVRETALAGIAQAALSALIIGAAFHRQALTVEFLTAYLGILQAAGLLILVGVAFARGARRGGGFSPALARGILAGGLKQHAATVAGFVYMRANQLTVVSACGPAEAGFFAVALNLALTAMILPGTFQTVLYPRVLQSSDDFEVTVRSLRLGFYGWGGLVAVIALLAKPVLLLYAGREFLPALPMLRVLLVAAWLLPLSSLAAPYCIKAGAFTACSLSAVALALVSLLANRLLVPRLFGLGAALATSLTAMTGFLLALGLLWWLSGKSPLGFLRIALPLRG